MSANSALFLTVDQSTSATKAMLFTPDGRLLDQESVLHRQIYPQPGWVEHDAEELFNNTIQGISTLLSRHPDILNNILALNITNQRETFVIFDRETGRPLYNAIVWQCQRGDAICKQLINADKEEIVHELTGLKIDTYFPATKLRWLIDNQSDLQNRLIDGSALFGTIDTYLIYRLTSRSVYATDHTNASRTLFYDIERLAWSHELCALFGLEFALLPDIRESSAWFGDTDLEGKLNRRISIYGVMGDSQAALFAQRCFLPGDVKVTLGTGSSILLNIGHEKHLSASGTVTALAWVLNGQPTYAYEGIINFTGATIAWLRDQMQIISNPAETEILARSVADSDGVYFIPAFVGLCAPYWRADARAAILGMTLSTTRAHIVRAALQSIGYIITDVLKAMSKDANITLNTVHADGGAVTNSFLMQFVADMTRINLRASQLPELSALGAVLCGALGLQIYSSLEGLRQIPSQFTEYNPILDSKVSQDRFSGWLSAVQQVLYQPNKDKE